MTRASDKDEGNKIREEFGFNPVDIGLRYRGFYIIKTPDPFSAYAKKGYLAVEARDGASNEPDCSVGKYPNYVGTEEDDFDRTYRYYYFKPVKDVKKGGR